MTDNVALLRGYTKEYLAESSGYQLHILVQPDTDLDSCFSAWDCDSQEFITINGWQGVFTPINDNGDSNE